MATIDGNPIKFKVPSSEMNYTVAYRTSRNQVEVLLTAKDLENRTVGALAIEATTPGHTENPASVIFGVHIPKSTSGWETGFGNPGGEGHRTMGGF